MLPEVIARLNTLVPDVAGRVYGAAQLSQLIAQNQLPQVTPAANVLPGVIRGGASNAFAGAFTQGVTDGITVALTFRTADPTGVAAFDRVHDIAFAVIKAVCGWAPPGTVGVFELLVGQVARFEGGLLVYQIDFAIGDQLRITP